MDIKYLYQEPAFSDSEPKPTTIPLLIDGKQGHILSKLYLPGGHGPHPAILLCHGYPGVEQNADMVQALRRVGFAVMVFHYAGSWNSPGKFTLSGCLEDAKTVLQFMKSNAEQWNIDRKSIFAVGHSFGGIVAAHILAQNRDMNSGILIAPWDVGKMYVYSEFDEDCRRNLWETLSCGFGWLNGISTTSFEEELKKEGESLALEHIATKLAKKDILCIAAEHDTNAPNRLHADPFSRLMRHYEAKNYICMTFSTDHGFQNCRLKLVECVTKFLISRANG